MEGGAQYFAGQVPVFRPAVQTRLRMGEAPTFPPSGRDAIILGGTVFDLLERQRGRDACSLLVSRTRRDGPERAIQIAFGESAHDVGLEWRRYLREDVPRRVAGRIGRAALVNQTISTFYFSATLPSRMSQPRTSGLSGSARETMTHTGSGQSSAWFRSCREGSAGLFVWEW